MEHIDGVFDFAGMGGAGMGQIIEADVQRFEGRKFCGQRGRAINQFPLFSIEFGALADPGFVRGHRMTRAYAGFCGRFCSFCI